jgi:Glycosyltransferases involved in cell wall biogenesis
MKNPTVDILMATFNGARYIAEQLESVIRQTYPDWRLLVHDDGSSDDTVTIVKRFAAADGRIQLLDDGVHELGAARNFMHLLKYSTSPLCMFCDQDDIWLEEKVGKLVQAIRGEHGPAAAYANAVYYRNGSTMRKATDIHPSRLRNMLFMNAGIQGCSLIFNRSLADRVKSYDGFLAMHDHLITLAAITFGKLIYLDEVLTLYRQHEHNHTSDHHMGRLKRLRAFCNSRNAVIDRVHFEANRSFYRYFQPQLTQKDRRLFQAYFDYVEKQTVLGRLWIIWKHKFELGDRRGLLAVKTLIRRAIN